ncbi:MAG: substrate-binding domain-containing protein [Acidobacteriaceae bacterium]
MNISPWIAALGLGILLTSTLYAQEKTQPVPPWSHGTNDPASNKGYDFRVPDIDNVPDLHGNPQNAGLVLFIGGNQFFVLPQLVAGFVKLHPELEGRIFYETLPPGILRKQIAADDTLTLGNLTLRVKPDVYEAGARVLLGMEQKKQVRDVTQYASNTLEIMVRSDNPKRIASLNDLGRADVRLSMPNPQWEGVANQIGAALRKAGGDNLFQRVYREKVANGSSVLTEIHHRQTPMRILQGHADAGVTWASEVKFQEKIGNPIRGVEIPTAQNITAIYAGGVMVDAPHPQAAAQWLEYLKTEQAQQIYRGFGFAAPAKNAK